LNPGGIAVDRGQPLGQVQLNLNILFLHPALPQLEHILDHGIYMFCRFLGFLAARKGQETFNYFGSPLLSR
jgi:hypothetical protein